MITERTLKMWRTNALWLKEVVGRDPNIAQHMGKATLESMCDRILRMTQELLDQHLIRKEKKRND